MITVSPASDLSSLDLTGEEVMVQGRDWSPQQQVRLYQAITNAAHLSFDDQALEHKLSTAGLLAPEAPETRGAGTHAASRRQVAHPASLIGSAPAWNLVESERRLAQWIPLVPSSWDEYVDGHKRRFAETYARVPAAPFGARAIEISAFPLSVAMLKELGYWTAATMFTERGEPTIATPSDIWPTFGLDAQIQFDIERHRLPLDDNSLDLVMAPEIIEHLPTDPQQLLVEANRVLKHGGLLVVTTPNLTSARSLIKGFRHEHPFNHPLFQPDASMDRHHIEYSISMLRPMMRAAGFDIELCETESVWSGYEWDMMRILDQNGYSTKDRGDNIFLIGRKMTPLVNRLPSAAYMGGEHEWTLSYRNQPKRSD